MGLKSVNLQPVLEVELESWACDTLDANFGHQTVLRSDIRAIPDSKVLEYKGTDLIVGGPTCQGFSVAGTTQFGVEEDPRNELLLWFTHWVQLIRPRIALLKMSQIF